MTAPASSSSITATWTPSPGLIVGRLVPEFLPSAKVDIHSLVLTDSAMRINGGQAPRRGQDWSVILHCYSEADTVYTAIEWREVVSAGVYADCTATAYIYDPITGVTQANLTATIAAQGTYPGKVTLTLADTATPAPGTWPFVVRLYWPVTVRYTDSIGGWLEVLPVLPGTL